MELEHQKKITVEDKILLHLFKNHLNPDSFEAPMSLSQVGISKVIGVRRSHVSHAAKRLKDKGQIGENIAHILGVKRRRKVYYLTPDGYDKARKLHEEVEETVVSFIAKDGTESQQSLRHIQKTTGLTFIEIINEVEKETFDYSKFLKQEEDSSLVKMVIRAPRIRKFVGRSHEIHKIHGWISENDKNFVVIYGIAGIGKTSLCLKIGEELYKEKNIFWLRIHEWDDLSVVLREVARFLQAIEKPQLATYLRQTEVIRLPQVSAILEEDLNESDTVLFFDDLHKIYPEYISAITHAGVMFPGHKEEEMMVDSQAIGLPSKEIQMDGSYIRTVVDTKLIQFFSMLVEVLDKVKGSSVVASSRFILPFYNRHSVTVQRSVVELFLTGLRIESTGKLFHGLREEELKKLYDITKGHPLFLELYSSTGSEGWETKDIAQYIKSEIVATLTAEEKKVLARICVFRHAVPTAAFVPEGVSTDSLESLVGKSFLKQVAQDLYDVHDIIKSFIYARQNKTEQYENHRQAELYFSRSDPRNPELLYHLIRQRKVVEAAQRAIENYEEYLGNGKLSPLMNLIEILLGEEHIHELEKFYIGSLIKVKGIIWNAWREWDNAMAEFKTALRIFTSLEDKKEIAEVHNLIGTIQYGYGDHPAAIESFKKSLDILEALEQEGLLEPGEDLEPAYFTLGIFYLEHGDWNNALVHYQRILEKFGDEESKRYPVLCMLADLNFKKEQVDKAIEIYQGCLEIIDGLEKPDHKRFDVFFNLAQVHAQKGEVEQSLDYFQRSLDFARDLGSSFHEAKILYEMGKLTQDPEKRTILLEEARDRYQNMKNTEIVDEIGQLLDSKD